MPSMQRRRGEEAVIYPTVIRTDNRGTAIKVADDSNPITVRAVFIPQRSAKAEVPGQTIINITRMIVTHDVAGVDLWSKVEAQGKVWDVVTPPAYRHGTRHTRHWSIDLRERP
jgi:hypothetical protein